MAVTEQTIRDLLSLLSGSSVAISLNHFFLLKDFTQKSDGEKPSEIYSQHLYSVRRAAGSLIGV